MTIMEDNKKYKILFVCLGNICRSPAGQGVMERIVDERGLKTAYSSTLPEYRHTTPATCPTSACACTPHAGG